jgi:uncharacterized protein
MLKAVCSRQELAGCSYYGCVSDLIERPELARLKEITHHVRTSRFQHCVNVSYYSYLVCRRLGLDSRSAARAGLLHDLFYYDRKEYNSARTKDEPSHSLKHSRVAENNAGRLTRLSDLERDIISRHMWPMTKKLPKYRESLVVCMIDKYCAVLEFVAGTPRSSR